MLVRTRFGAPPSFFAGTVHSFHERIQFTRPSLAGAVANLRNRPCVQNEFTVSQPSGSSGFSKLSRDTVTYTVTAPAKEPASGDATTG